MNDKQRGLYSAVFWCLTLPTLLAAHWASWTHLPAYSVLFTGVTVFAAVMAIKTWNGDLG